MVEDIAVRIKYVEENAAALANLKAKILGFSRNIEANTIKAQRTMSASWKTRYAQMINSLREHRLAAKRSADVVASALNKQKDVLQELSMEGRRLARSQKNINKLMHGGAQKLINNATRVNKTAREYTSFGSVLTMSFDRWKKFNQEGGVFNTVGARAANKMRLMTHGMRGFRMELLGVMFFGMAVARVFQMMFQPALQMLGVFELWNVTLGVVFLPIMLALLPLFLDLINWLISMPEPVKMVIGVLAILGFFLFKLLFLVGMVGLGIGSLIVAFGPAAVLSAFGKAITFITGMLPLLGIILAVLIVAVIGFVAAWKENFGNIQQWVALMWDGLKQFFDGIKQIIEGVIDIVVGMFSGDATKVIAGAKKIWEGVKNVFFGFIKFIGGFIVTLGIALGRAFLGMIITLTDLLGKAFGVMWEKVFKPVGEFLKKWVIDPITNAFKIALNWVIDKVNALIEGFNKLPGPDIPLIPSLQQGTNFVPRTGLYRLHEGEGVVPATQNTFNTNVNVNASSNVDIELMKRQLTSMWTDELANVIRR